MEKYTTAIVFDHRQRTEDGATGPLEVRLTVARKSYYINTGIRVKRKEWCGAVVNRKDADVLNERLGIVVQAVCREANSMLADDMAIDAATIRERVFDAPSRASDDMFRWIVAQVDVLNVTDGTRRHYRGLVRRLEEFGRLMSWRDLTVERIYEWDTWLHQLKKRVSNADIQAGREKENICDAAVWNYHKRLKMLINRAMRFGKVSHNPYATLRGAFRRAEKESTEYLTDDEMTAFESLHPVEGTQMAMARDLFVFQMYTGLSYSDAQAFSIDDYKQVDGRWVNVGERIKTGVSYVSQLLPPVIDVLERYGWQAPRIDNTKYNKCLKVLGVAAGIKQPLHSHLARHTFATWMLRNGVPIEHVSKMIGHTNVKQTQRYAKVMPTSVFNDFERVSKKWK